MERELYTYQNQVVVEGVKTIWYGGGGRRICNPTDNTTPLIDSISDTLFGLPLQASAHDFFIHLFPPSIHLQGYFKMTEPSKVIHVRNVGHEISEPDLLQLFQPFGVINKLVMLRAKNQALLQMQDVPSAVNAMQFYANVQPSIRGRNVYVQFSSHQELTTMEQNTQGRGDEVQHRLVIYSLPCPLRLFTILLEFLFKADQIFTFSCSNLYIFFSVIFLIHVMLCLCVGA
ncbi:hypothetical protein L6452_05021 [Arctium lappa]|uniref:Uncharacterized protein n=1 Tax=Arctium lappa TaxID=4217 RepID=A0ACB9EFY1_ARCLA|nr:hypothetical protein L6452_05021 [Arctium lappa]